MKTRLSQQHCSLQPELQTDSRFPKRNSGRPRKSADLKDACASTSSAMVDSINAAALFNQSGRKGRLEPNLLPPGRYVHHMGSSKDKINNGGAKVSHSFREDATIHSVNCLICHGWMDVLDCVQEAVFREDDTRSGTRVTMICCAW